jgi:hypothetical protein
MESVIDQKKNFESRSFIYFFQIPAYQRGGVIIPQRLRKRRASMLAIHDPITLVVALDRNVCLIGSRSFEIFIFL